MIGLYRRSHNRSGALRLPRALRSPHAAIPQTSQPLASTLVGFRGNRARRVLREDWRCDGPRRRRAWRDRERSRWNELHDHWDGLDSAGRIFSGGPRLQKADREPVQEHTQQSARTGHPRRHRGRHLVARLCGGGRIGRVDVGPRSRALPKRDRCRDDPGVRRRRSPEQIRRLHPNRATRQRLLSCVRFALRAPCLAQTAHPDANRSLQQAHRFQRGLARRRSRGASTDDQRAPDVAVLPLPARERSVQPSNAKWWSYTPTEMAEKLAYFLLNSTPDAALLDAADAGRLTTADDIRTQAERLFTTPRGRASVGNFASELFHVDIVFSKAKDATLFPTYTPGPASGDGARGPEHVRSARVRPENRAR